MAETSPAPNASTGDAPDPAPSVAPDAQRRPPRDAQAPSAPHTPTGDAPDAPDRGRDRGGDRRTFGWRTGLLLGLGVLVVVYAIAELTAAVPALRDAVEHEPVAIGVLIVGTVSVLLSLLPMPSRRE